MSDQEKDYRSTLFLPQTAFPMKAGLPNKEPGILAKWQEMDLYKKLREDAKGREKFVLHDGPPYANGDIHIGHAMNKILKDVIVRAKQMTGFDAPYVPGWDCHGLPIEWKIEEKYRKKKKNKDEVDPVEFRQECRDFAAGWIDVQKEQFKRLGVLGDWDNPYTTMAYSAEATIVRELTKFVMNGSLYQGSKPVMWSPVEKTALAEAEVEYQDHTSVQIDVAFKVVSTKCAAIEDAYVVIWTTTPWTIPANRAISYGETISYGVYEIAAVGEGSPAKVGLKIVIADALKEAVLSRTGITELNRVADVPAAELEGTICHHPWHGQGYDYDVPLIEGDHVTIDAGTGFVHTAPGHGQEDYEVGLKYGIEIPHTVSEDGTYFEHVPLVAGEHVYKVADHVCDLLTEQDALLGKGKLVHSYPHSWRSKAPLIFRNTSQWFISMSKTNLRDTALKAIDEVNWVPAQSKNRIRSMVEGRPDWVISRQRAWGVPITVFVEKATGNVLQDDAVNERIVQAVQEGGADAWYLKDAQDLLGNDYSADDYEKVMDILDVWFDSGSTHAFVVEGRDDLGDKAHLYLEGSDQHRGWFQSSLLESSGTRGRAPYDAVMTHGFVLDGNGRKMSKSMGNVISPLKIMEQYGADIIRLWVCSTDYFDDVRIGNDIIQGQVDAYRKIRNTMRYLLGNLSAWEEEERLPYDEMPELEKYVLHRLHELDQLVRKQIDGFDFNPLYQGLYHFCILDLSSFYFDIRKDSLYCDAKMSTRRRAARTVLDILFNHLVTWFAPILSFTTEEVWASRHGEEAGSVHLQQFAETDSAWHNPDLAAKWQKLRNLRRVITGALEVDRREKRIGSSLQGHPTLYLEDDAYDAVIKDADLAELCITSSVTVQKGVAPEGAFRIDDIAGLAVTTTLAEGGKCERCWMILPEVGQNPKHDDLCNRCSDAVSA